MRGSAGYYNSATMPDDIHTIPIPSHTFIGLAAFMNLGKERLHRLSEVQKTRTIDLDIGKVIVEFASYIECDQQHMQRAILDSLIPLNGLRRTLNLETDIFLASLAHTVEQQAPDEWKREYGEAWPDVAPYLRPFFVQDNFFSHISQSLELLSQRPAVLQSARLLSDLRPIYDEDATRTVALIHTNTLMLQYWDGENSKLLHLALDTRDLASMQSELERARQRLQISRNEAENKGDIFLTFGDLNDEGE